MPTTRKFQATHDGQTFERRSAKREYRCVLIGKKWLRFEFIYSAVRGTRPELKIDRAAGFASEWSVIGWAGTRELAEKRLASDGGIYAETRIVDAFEV